MSNRLVLDLRFKKILVLATCYSIGVTQSPTVSSVSPSSQELVWTKKVRHPVGFSKLAVVRWSTQKLSPKHRSNRTPISKWASDG